MYIYIYIFFWGGCLSILQDLVFRATTGIHNFSESPIARTYLNNSIHMYIYIYAFVCIMDLYLLICFVFVYVFKAYSPVKKVIDSRL